MVWPFNKNIFRSLGFVGDQKGILRRYKREKQNWNSHLEHTKDYIERQIGDQKFKSIAVLGSGFLLDLPIDKLLSATEKLYLYDANHPKEIRKQYSENSAVIFIQKDITALAEHIYHANSPKDITALLAIPAQTWAESEHDCIISLNILNQLDIILVDYLKEQMSIPENIEQALRTKIQSEHVQSLVDTFSILIADTEEIQTIMDTGAETVKMNIHTKIHFDNISSDHETWYWNFDNNGRYIENTAVKFKVNAVTYLKD